MSLLQNTITLRGVDYTVTEVSGKHMTKFRQIFDSERWKAENYIVMACCIEPKVTQPDVDNMPQFVIDAISTEAFRLTKLDSPETPGKG